jgi:hypothetical protein
VREYEFNVGPETLVFVFGVCTKLYGTSGGVPSYVEQYQATQVEVSSPPKLFFLLPG